jgi:hypothetical protein
MPVITPLNLQRSSLAVVQSPILIEQLLLTTPLELQDSPRMMEDDVRWLQRFALYLIAEFCAVEEISVDEISEFTPDNPQ